jgi:hypothetical protein
LKVGSGLRCRAEAENGRIAKVQEWLGHANIATTRICDHRKTRPEDSSPTFNSKLRTEYISSGRILHRGPYVVEQPIRKISTSLPWQLKAAGIGDQDSPPLPFGRRQNGDSDGPADAPH